MEWMLQVVDEIDDAIAAVHHGWLALYARFDVPVTALIAAAASANGYAAGSSRSRSANRLT